MPSSANPKLGGVVGHVLAPMELRTMGGTPHEPLAQMFGFWVWVGLGRVLGRVASVPGDMQEPKPDPNI